jgi:NitT/TauT family transport system ATP-binding protein
MVHRYLELVSLLDKSGLYPSQLSGGMKQRVSLARAFCYPSDLILMDEPFKALDHKLKRNLIDAFKQIWISDKRTVVAVIHEVDEALLLGHEIIIFSRAPVRILNKIKIDIPIDRRDIQNQQFQQWKADILKIVDL